MLDYYRAASILLWPAYMTSSATMEMGSCLDYLRHTKSKTGGSQPGGDNPWTATTEGRSPQGSSLWHVLCTPN